jgi:hypothetical protein
MIKSGAIALTVWMRAGALPVFSCLRLSPSKMASAVLWSSALTCDN